MHLLWRFIMPLVAAACLAIMWIGGGAGEARIDAIPYALAALAFSLDSIDMVFRLYQLRLGRAAGSMVLIADFAQRRGEAYSKILTPVQPIGLVLSVHDLGSEVDAFCERMARYRENTWIVDDFSTDATAVKLRRAGWRCLTLTDNVKKPAAIRRLLEFIPAGVQTIVVLDPDSHIDFPDDAAHAAFDRAVHDFQRSGAAAACPRVALRPRNLLERVQQLEYTLCFRLGRATLGDCCTVGGLALYRRDALAWALSQHSLSVYAEDLELSLLLLARGERIYYEDRIVVVTEGQPTLRRWFSQRVGWYFGLLKVCVQCRRQMLTIARRNPMAGYQYIVYLQWVCVIGFPLKLLSASVMLLSLATGIAGQFSAGAPLGFLSVNAMIFVLVYLKYVALLLAVVAFVVPPAELPSAFAATLLFPLYSVVQLLPIGVGYLNWLLIPLLGRRIYADHYHQSPEIELLQRAKEIA
jgi:cellulose synthase/poly-beta-1,6-N-acetylglucosamine synthase-like glycosyltransferase